MLHFIDDWKIEDDKNWDNTFNYPRYDNNDNDDIAAHCVKFWLIEDKYVNEEMAAVCQVSDWWDEKEDGRREGNKRELSHFQTNKKATSQLVYL